MDELTVLRKMRAHARAHTHACWGLSSVTYDGPRLFSVVQALVSSPEAAS